MGVPGNAFLFDLDGTLVDIIDSRPILQQFMSSAAPCRDALPWIHRVTNAICKVALRI